MKNLTFFVVLIITAILIYKASFPASIDKNLNLTIEESRTSISNINDKRDIKSTRAEYIDIVLFKSGQSLMDSHGRNFYLSKNFYLRIDATMEVKKSGEYRFAITSDDGFALKIDNKEICSYEGLRASDTTYCNIALKEGDALKIEIDYFQAGGGMVLIGRYSYNGGRYYHIGESSEYLSFKP